MADTQALNALMRSLVKLEDEWNDLYAEKYARLLIKKLDEAGWTIVRKEPQ